MEIHEIKEGKQIKHKRFPGVWIQLRRQIWKTN
jgi:hypothetical protein